MALLLIAYPRLSSADYSGIQSIRPSHDERYYGVVEPHFTFVFPVDGVPEDLLAEHVRTVTRDTPSIQFTLRSATVVKDFFGDVRHTFLVPDEGHSRLVRLHDRLY